MDHARGRRKDATIDARDFKPLIQWQTKLQLLTLCMPAVLKFRCFRVLSNVAAATENSS